MRLLICAGGTGGGVYPALVILQTLKNKAETKSDDSFKENLLWVGSKDGMEANLVKRLDIPFSTIPAAGVHGVGIHALPRNITRLLRGFFAARKQLISFKPDVLLFTGGYVAVPMALASRLLLNKTKQPRIVLYVPDIEPGLALKTLARFADNIAVTAEESSKYFPDKRKIKVTGYPTRPGLAEISREEARAKFDIKADDPVLLIYGGSLGARSINRALLPILAQLLPKMHVIHLSGNLDWGEVEAAQADLKRSLPQFAGNYHAFPYLHDEMNAALIAADLVVCRAGASTLGELPVAGLPAVLVPYPYAWHYQMVNAEYLAQRGAAIVLADDELPRQLLSIVTSFMDDKSRRMAMKEAMHQLAAKDAANAILEIINGMSNPAAKRRG